MSARICVFKGCHSMYSRGNTACNDVTIFAFPKDAKRAAQWGLLGQVHPKISAKQLFMCSKHFDSKYLSVTKNRTMLLGEAVPKPYEKQKNRSPCASPIEIEDEEEEEMEEEGKLHTDQSYLISLDDVQQNDENLIMIESSKVEDTPKVKQFDVSIVPPTRKRARSPAGSPLTDSCHDFEDEEEDDVADPIIDSTEVTIFQLKSEEYVQMSRQYYEREKRQMRAQLRNYKQILRNFKAQLMSLKDI